MIVRKKGGAVNDEEKRVIKALLAKNWRNQDIQALVNIGRENTINSARITETKKDNTIAIASDEEVAFFEIKKRSFDHKTGLNLIDHERLIRAREAIVLAVQVFNSAALRFKSEVFTMLANVAWTYLLHEYYERKGIVIVQKDGRSLLLSQMIDRHDCPLSEAIKDNLRSLKILRDEVEHKLLGRADEKWLGLFQACCLNFDKAMCKEFGDKLSLANELSFALQFTKMNIAQLKTLNNYEIPAHIEAVDARLKKGMTEDQLANLEYQFQVVYTIDAVSKSRAHFQFVQPDSNEGKDIRNVLVKHKFADHMYPHKASKVVALVCEKIGKNFTQHNHTLAWKKFKVRPAANSAEPKDTNRDYCIYHLAHGDYTYSDQWVQLLADEINTQT